MPLPRNLDPTDLVILRAIAEKPEIRTREVEISGTPEPDASPAPLAATRA